MTSSETGIVHVGLGNFARAHQAAYLQRLFDSGPESEGAAEWGVCGVGMLPGDARMRDAMRAQDYRYTLVLKHPDGTLEHETVGAVRDYLFAPDDPWAVVARMAEPRTRIVSLTITEGGYNVSDVTGSFNVTDPAVVADCQPGAAPYTVFGLVVRALQRRRDAGVVPFTVMSCDNIENNGGVARDSFTTFAELAEPGLGAWVREHVPFPSSMVDRITPATTDADRTLVRDTWGIDDDVPVMAEPFTQWVLEDHFSAGRPDLERVGVQLVDDVRPYELMKLRLLNAGHQVMAYAGVLLGYTYVHEAAIDPLVQRLLRAWWAEAVPTLDPVPGIDLAAYQVTLLERFGNPGIADTLARLCAFTSDRIPKFMLPVVRHHLDIGGPVAVGAAVAATWARYLEGTDDAGLAHDVVDRRRLPAGAALLHQQDLFGDLATDGPFSQAFSRTLDSLHRKGTRAALEDVLTG
jgi:mannitol 2-dehydrogenase